MRFTLDRLLLLDWRLLSWLAGKISSLDVDLLSETDIYLSAACFRIILKTRFLDFKYFGDF